MRGQAKEEERSKQMRRELHVIRNLNDQICMKCLNLDVEKKKIKSQV